MSELPEGWCDTTVGSVSHDISYGFTTSASSTPKGPKFLRITDIQNGIVDWKAVPFCKVRPSDASRFLLKAGDIVFARTGATTGKSFLIRSPPEAVFASYLIRVRPSELILPELMAYFFQSASYWRQITENISGSAQPNCNATKLSSLALPLPALNEQRRIVAKLEKLLRRVDAARARLATIPRILKRFRQSVLAAACSGKLTADWRKEGLPGESSQDLFKRVEACKKQLITQKLIKNEPPLPGITDEHYLFDVPSTWNWVRLGEICSHISDIDHKMPKAVSQGVKFLSAKDLLDDGTLNFTEDIKLISEEDYARLSRKIKPQREDIIYSRIGARLGKARLVQSDEKFLVSYSCCVIRPLIVDPAYVARFLDSAVVLSRAINDAQSIGVPDLGIQKIKEFAIPLPPVAEQQEIVRRVEALFKTADTLEARYRKAKAHVDKLTQSILAKAFRGELVPQDPNDEPASLLLERIRRGRDDRSTPAKEKGGADVADPQSPEGSML